MYYQFFFLAKSGIQQTTMFWQIWMHGLFMLLFYLHGIHGDWCRGPQVEVLQTNQLYYCGQPSVILVNSLIHNVGFHLIEIVFVTAFVLFQSFESLLLFSYFLSSFCLEHIYAARLLSFLLQGGSISSALTLSGSWFQLYHRERILETSTLSCNEEEEEITKPPKR